MRSQILLTDGYWVPFVDYLSNPRASVRLIIASKLENQSSKWAMDMTSERGNCFLLCKYYHICSSNWRLGSSKCCLPIIKWVITTVFVTLSLFACVVFISMSDLCRCFHLFLVHFLPYISVYILREYSIYWFAVDIRCPYEQSFSSSSHKHVSR